jgi:S1-C subfamily serine protease
MIKHVMSEACGRFTLVLAISAVLFLTITHLCSATDLNSLGTDSSTNTTKRETFKVMHEPEPCADTIADIYNRSSSTVVSISATAINPYKLVDRLEHIIGSGFIIDSNGLVLTNAHVVYGRHSIEVILDDGTICSAKLLGVDLIFDLAVIRISIPSGKSLPVSILGDSDKLRVGEDVIAIGNPYGLNQTLTRGVVSAINRIVPINPFLPPRSLIQTDCPINPGNSGGPLLNRCGEVVGINTSVILGAENIAFAVPINLAMMFLQSIKEHGRVIRPWVGFHGQFVSKEVQNFFGFSITEGLLVEVVEPGSPAEKAGLLGGQHEFSLYGLNLLIGGDIITAVNGVRLDSPDKLDEIVQTIWIGKTISMTVYREGHFRKVEYVLQERPILPWDMPWYFSAGPITEDKFQTYQP